MDGALRLSLFQIEMLLRFPSSVNGSINLKLHHEARGQAHRLPIDSGNSLKQRYPSYLSAMNMATATVAKQGLLPPRLIDFFARFPPRLYGAYFTGQSIPTIKEKIALRGNKKTGEAPISTSTTKSIEQSLQSSTIVPEFLETTISEATSTIQSSSEVPQLEPLKDPETSENLFDLDPTTDKLEPNPFLPYRNPATGHWRGPRISLRRQAELFKLARLYGVEPLLPPSIKATAFKEQRLLERGLAVKGTGEGEKVKGHKWEREMGGMLQKRIEAMEKMPALVREWKQRGNGRGWKKYPK